MNLMKKLFKFWKGPKYDGCNILLCLQRDAFVFLSFLQKSQKVCDSLCPANVSRLLATDFSGYLHVFIEKIQKRMNIVVVPRILCIDKQTELCKLFLHM